MKDFIGELILSLLFILIGWGLNDKPLNSVELMACIWSGTLYYRVNKLEKQLKNPFIHYFKSR